MEITQRELGDVLEIAVNGRIDAYWADHLDAALDAAVREGHHRIALDCAKVGFLSSAGIGILVKHYKELTRIAGSFRIVNPSKTVAAVLKMTRLTPLLGESAAPGTGAPVSRRIESGGLELDVFDLDRAARLVCRTIGDPTALATGCDASALTSLGAMAPAFAIGVGALGTSVEDCRDRFGEMLSVAGATAYQPGDGTNVPDYLLAHGALAADVRVLYGLACDGGFSHLVRFDPISDDAVVPMSQVAAASLAIAEADAVGFVLVAETAGLVGASLRRSPAHAVEGGDYFAHPDVRRRLTFTGERAFPHGVTLVAGIVSAHADGPAAAHLRPLSGGLVGHVHAAAFSFRPIQKGRIGLQATVDQLFESDRLAGVLHLLNDDRRTVGVGESEFLRGACWVGRIG